MPLTDGERMIALMLCDLRAGTPVDDGIDPNFISRAIHEDHLWAIPLKYPIIMRGEKTPDLVKETYRFMSLWDDIGYSFDHLSAAQRDKLKILEPTFSIQFPGFDGNSEADYISVAAMVIEELDAFSRFSGLDLNSHVPMVDAYRRMLRVYEPLAANPSGPPNFSPETIAELLAARRHPESIAY